MYKKIIHHSKRILEKIRNTKKIKKENNEPDKDSLNSRDALESYISHQKKTTTVISEISLLSAVKIISVLLGIFLLWKFIIATSDLLISFFFAIFLASVLYSSVSFFEKHNIPRIFSILISFILVFGFFGLLISNIIPAVIDQSIALGNWFLGHVISISSGDFTKIPLWFQQFGPQLQEYIQQIDEYMRSLQTNG